MILATENTRRTSADFSQYFDFLTKDFGLKISTENYSVTGGDKYVRVFRNQFVQVELAGDQSYFHAEIRRLINDEPRPYSDRENNIGFEDLAVLTTNNNYDHFEFYPGLTGWIKVLENTAKLFKTSRRVFTTDEWIDTRKIKELKDEEFFNKFGFRPSDDKNKPTFFDLIKGHALKLIDKGFLLALDSSELPPYNDENLTPKIILETKQMKIKISQRDWRDNYSNYYIEVNGQEKFQIDLKNQPDIDSTAQIFNDQLDKLILRRMVMVGTEISPNYQIENSLKAYSSFFSFDLVTS
jgi:hypothetical protein